MYLVGRGLSEPALFEGTRRDSINIVPISFPIRPLKSIVRSFIVFFVSGVGYRNRTGVRGFAIRCITTLPTRLIFFKIKYLLNFDIRILF